MAYAKRSSRWQPFFAAPDFSSLLVPTLAGTECSPQNQNLQPTRCLHPVDSIATWKDNFNSQKNLYAIVILSPAPALDPFCSFGLIVRRFGFSLFRNRWPPIRVPKNISNMYFDKLIN